VPAGPPHGLPQFQDTARYRLDTSKVGCEVLKDAEFASPLPQAPVRMSIEILHVDDNECRTLRINGIVRQCWNELGQRIRSYVRAFAQRSLLYPLVAVSTRRSNPLGLMVTPLTFDRIPTSSSW